MDYQSLLQSLTPQMVQQLRQALELQRWPDGRVLTEAQKGHCLEALIQWEARHLPEHQRTGYIDRGAKAEAERCTDTQVLTLGDQPPPEEH